MQQWTGDAKRRWIDDWCRHDMTELIVISDKNMEEDDKRLLDESYGA